jgi:hypothetical protein
MDRFQDGNGRLTAAAEAALEAAPSGFLPMHADRIWAPS